MTFYYIRHGEPNYENDTLTEKGIEQAKALAKRFEKSGLDEIYSSTSGRAFETMQETAKLLKIEPIVVPLFHENNAWEYFHATKMENGKEKEDWLHAIPEYAKLFASNEIVNMGFDYYKHEKLKDFHFEKIFEKYDEEIDKIFEKHGYFHDRNNHYFTCEKPNDDKVALFAHGQTGLCLLSSILDIPFPMLDIHFDYYFTGVTVIHMHKMGENYYPIVRQFASDSHLYNEDIWSQGWV